MKRLAGWAIYALVLVLRPVRRFRLWVLMLRIESLCRRIARNQKKLARLLRRYDRIENK